MKQMLRSVKDDIGLKLPGIYRISCDCGASYSKQTGCTILEIQLDPDTVNCGIGLQLSAA